MGVRYEGMKLIWLKQAGGKTTTIAWVSPDEGTLGLFAGGSKVAIPVKVRVTNGPKPTFSLANGQLPPGLTFDTATGSISGTPENATGDYSFTLRATSGEATVERAFQIAIATNAAPVWVTPSGSLGSPFDSTEYDYTLEATDPEGQPVVYSLVTGSLPGGLKLDPATGEIKGRLRYVNANTTFYFTVKASDGIASTNESFNITVKANEAPYWVSNAKDEITSFITGVYNEFQFVANDPEGAELIFTITHGELPEGITLSEDGLLSGTLENLDANKKVTVTILASDGIKGVERSFQIALVRNVPPVWTAPTPAATEVSGYNVTFPLLAVDPNGKPLTFSVAEGSELPSGFLLVGNTIIANLPEVAETTDYAFSIVASDGVLSTTKEIVVRSLNNTPPVWNTPSDLGEVLEGRTVSIQLNAIDPEGKPVTYTATSDLPLGLSLATGGRIVGTPIDLDEDTSFEFSIVASDGVHDVERDFTLVVKANVAPVWQTAAGSLGTAYGQEEAEFTLLATDANNQSVTYSITDGILPPGLTLQGNKIRGYAGILTTTDADYTFTVRASDGSLFTDRTFTITHGANLPLVWETPAVTGVEAFEKTPVSFTVKAIDPDGKAVRYGLPQNGRLPEGFSMNAVTGVISGTVPTVTQDRDIHFTLTAYVPGQQLSAHITRTFSIVGKFNTAPEFVSATTMNIVESRASSLRISAINSGNGPMVYTVVAGDLPAGLTLQPNGQISGFAPAEQEDKNYTFTVRANNGIKTSEKAFTITVEHNVAPVWTTEAGSLGTVFAGANRNLTVAATDANGQAVIYSVVSGSLPTGMSLHPTLGLISGKPQIAANDVTSTFTLGASDGVLRVDREFSIVVSANAAPSWTTPAGSLGEVVRNKTFSISLSATDAETSPLTYSIVGGSLPQGILLNPNTGAIVGRAPDVTQDEVYTFTVRVSDGVLFSDREFSISVNMDAAPIWATPAGSLGSVLAGYAAIFPFSASDPEGLPVTYTMISGSLPAGWGFSDRDRRIASPEGGSALSTVDQTFSFTIRASDGQVFSDRQFSVTVLKNTKPTWNAVYNTNLGQRKERSDIDFTVQATDPEAMALTYVVTDGALPGGITLDPQTGKVSGKLQFVDSDTDFAFTIKAYDGKVYSDGLNYTLRVLFDSPPIWQTPAGTLGTGLEDTEVSYTVAATSNGEEVTYSLKFGSNLPGELTLDEATGAISGKLPLVELESVDYNFTLVATNPTGKTSERAFKIVVQDNVAPVWQTAGGLLVTDLAGTPFSFTLTATDGNNTPLTYSIVEGTLPTGVTFDTATRVLSGTLPMVETDTTFSITIGASDGNIRTDREFRFRSLKDTAPVWTTAADLGTAVEQAGYSTNLVAVDNQGKTITYSLKAGSVLPGSLVLFGSRVDGQNPIPAGRLMGTLPVNDVVGTEDTYTFTIIASDGTLSTEREFSLKVKHNSAPVWTTAAGSLGSVVEGQLYTQTLSASDPDGNPVTYALKNGSVLPSGLSLSAAGVISGAAGSVTADTVTSFTVVATDGLRSVERTFSITVTNAVAPVDTFSDEVSLLLQMNGDYYDNTGKTVYGTNSAGKLVLWYTNQIRDDIMRTVPNSSGVAMSSVTNSGKGSLDFRGLDSGKTSRLLYGGGTSSSPGYPQQIDMQDFTIEAWVKFTPRGTENQTIFSHMIQGLVQNAKYGLAIQYRPGTGMVAHLTQENPNSATPISTIAGNFADDAWHHVAITRKGTIFRFFVDGVAGPTLTSAVYGVDHYLIGSCYLGNHTTFDQGLNGFVDNFRLIIGEALYTEAFTPSPTLAFTGGPSITSDNAKTDFGQSLKLTSAGQGLSIPYYSDISPDLNTSEVTFEAWVRPDDNTTTGSIFSKSTASTTSFAVSKVGSNYVLTYFYNNTQGVVTATNKVIAGQWQHIAMVMKRGTTHTMTLFIDGVNSGSASIQNGALPSQTTEALFIGTNRNQSTFLGQIDEVRVTKGARYQANFIPSAIQTDALPKFKNTDLVQVVETMAATYDVSAEDIGNSGSLTYSTTTLPNGLTLSPTTGIVSGTNPEAMFTAMPFTVTVTNGKGNKQKRTYNVLPILNTTPSALALHWRFNDSGVGVTTPLANFWPTKGTISTSGGSATNSTRYAAAPGRPGEFALNTKAGVAGRNQLTNELAMLNGNSTLEGWFYITAQSPNNCTFFSVSSTGLRVYAQPTGLTIDYNGVTGSARRPITLNTWHHVAVVRNGAEVKVYYDGVFMQQFAAATIPVTEFNIGSIGFSTGANFCWQTDTFLRNWNIYSDVKYLADFTPVFDNYKAPMWSTSPNSLKAGAEGDSFSLNLVAEAFGGRTVTYASSDLPAGVTMTPAGVVTGVYPAASSSFTVVATDSTGATTLPRTFAIPVIPQNLYDPLALYTRTLFPMTGATGAAPTDLRDSTAVTYYTNTGATQVAIRPNQSKWGGGSASFSSAHLNTDNYDHNGGGSHMFYNNSVPISSADDYTVEMWVYQTVKNDPARHNYLWSYYPNTDGTLLNINSAGMLTYNVGSSGAASIASTTEVTMHAWHHVALSRESGTMRLFLDGVLVGSIADTRALPAGIMAIGGFENPSFRMYHQFKGFINDFRFTHRKARYTSTFTPPKRALDVKGPNGIVPPILGWTFNKAVGASSASKIALDAGSSTVTSAGAVSFVADANRNVISFETGGYLDLNSGTQLALLEGNFTFETWYSGVLSGTNPTQFSLLGDIMRMFYWNDGTVGTPVMAFTYNGVSARNPNIPPANTWTHLAVVKNGNQLTFYVNGVGGSPVSVSSANVGAYIANRAVRINGYTTNTNYSAASKYADMGFSKYAKYTGNFTPPTAPPTDSFGF